MHRQYTSSNTCPISLTVFVSVSAPCKNRQFRPKVSARVKPSIDRKQSTEVRKMGNILFSCLFVTCEGAKTVRHKSYWQSLLHCITYYKIPSFIYIRAYGVHQPHSQWASKIFPNLCVSLHLVHPRHPPINMESLA